jgi:Fe2+ transport system protein FeoA
MGLVVGERIVVLQNARRGPVIVALCGCRIILGRGMAEKILVE